MASFKKNGQANTVKKGQVWRNIQNGRIGEIRGKTKGGKSWNMNIGEKVHHVNEGTLLKFFELLS